MVDFSSHIIEFLAQMEFIMTKAEVRKQIKLDLQKIGKKFPAYSETICLKLAQTEIYKKAEIILSYMALNDEVDLTKFHEQAISDGKKIFIPRIVPGTSLMDFYEFTALKNLETGSYGIFEPKIDGLKFETSVHSEKILILVPGRAFSKNKLRVGRGKGYYDIYLSKLKKSNEENLILTGVCFQIQILDKIPAEPHDIPMDFIITEENLF